MNRGGNDSYRDAVARSVDAQVERAETCPGCGQVKGSGLGDHIVGCPELTKRPAPPVEPWEALARERKANKIASTLLRVLPDITADQAAELDRRGREAAARLARVRPASDATWKLVVARLADRQRVA